MGVARNVCLEPRLVPGGGAVEMAISRALTGEYNILTDTQPIPDSVVGSIGSFSLSIYKVTSGISSLLPALPFLLSGCQTIPL